jgi:hypothetical protein
MVLVDSKGNVEFDQPGFKEDALLTAVSKLGPEYAFLAPAKPDPCAVAKATH